MTGVSNSGAWVPSPHVQMGARNLVLGTPKMGTQGAEAGLLTCRLQVFITRCADALGPEAPWDGPWSSLGRYGRMYFLETSYFSRHQVQRARSYKRNGTE